MSANLVFEKVCEVCDIDYTELVEARKRLGYTPSALGAINRAVAELLAFGATPDDIEKRAAVYHTKWPSASLTPLSLAKHWPSLKPRPIPSVLSDQQREALENMRQQMESY